MTFNEKKFKQYLKNIEERKDVTHSLKSLIRMDIPNGLIKEVIHETEKYLRNENFWKPAMKLIKKLDLQSKCPDLSVYAKRLKDSKSMKMAWRNARIEKMDEIEWIKEQERKMENKERKRHSIEIEKKDEKETNKKRSNKNKYRKWKKKERKRKRRAHYSRK